MDAENTIPEEAKVSDNKQVEYGSLTEKERRASILSIMKDPNLDCLERRRSIQRLMDGRRHSRQVSRSSNSLAAAAAVAASFYSTSEDGSDDEDLQSKRSSFNSNFNNPSRRCSLSVPEDNESKFMVAYDALGNPQGDPHTMETLRPVCTHYERQCSMISPCCGAVFGCRICHDECETLPKRINPSNNSDVDMRSSFPPEKNVLGRQDTTTTIGGDDDDEEEDHEFDRFAVSEVICRQCYTRQSSNTNNCIHCNIQFGQYHCSICNLWMSNDEMPYHCSACGFCRVGGRENFKHCFQCDMCVDAESFNNHNCKSDKYKTACPVCYENLFSSRLACHEMPCGHTIHWHCFEDYIKHDTRCPICKKTAELPENMLEFWDQMNMSISLQPIPDEMAKVVHICCNDCEQSDFHRSWHPIGVRCHFCSSFNTTIKDIILTGVDAAQYISAQTSNNDNDVTGDSEMN